MSWHDLGPEPLNEDFLRVYSQLNKDTLYNLTTTLFVHDSRINNLQLSTQNVICPKTTAPHHIEEALLLQLDKGHLD